MAGALSGTATGSLGGLFGFPFGFFGFGRPVCVFGRVNLLAFIAGPTAAIVPPVSGGVIAQVTTLTGATIPLVQTRPIPFGTTLSAVDNQFAVVCGTPTITTTGQLALDVTAVIPLTTLLASGGLGALGGLSGLGGLGALGGLSGLGGLGGLGGLSGVSGLGGVGGLGGFGI